MFVCLDGVIFNPHYFYKPIWKEADGSITTDSDAYDNRLFSITIMNPVRDIASNNIR